MKRAKQPGLAQRIAESLGREIQHQRREPAVFRSRAHRMTVASLDCVSCRRARRSQAAHLNLLTLGKGLGLKVSDAFVVPLCCDDLERRGCHRQLDQGGVFDHDTAVALQMRWLLDTRDMLIRIGKWPPAAQLDVERFLPSFMERAA